MMKPIKHLCKIKYRFNDALRTFNLKKVSVPVNGYGKFATIEDEVTDSSIARKAIADHLNRANKTDLKPEHVTFSYQTPHDGDALGYELRHIYKDNPLFSVIEPEYSSDISEDTASQADTASSINRSAQLNEIVKHLHITSNSESDSIHGSISSDDIHPQSSKTSNNSDSQTKETSSVTSRGGASTASITYSRSSNFAGDNVNLKEGDLMRHTSAAQGAKISSEERIQQWLKNSELNTTDQKYINEAQLDIIPDDIRTKLARWDGTRQENVSAAIPMHNSLPLTEENLHEHNQIISGDPLSVNATDGSNNDLQNLQDNILEQENTESQTGNTFADLDGKSDAWTLSGEPSPTPNKAQKAISDAKKALDNTKNALSQFHVSNAPQTPSSDTSLDQEVLNKYQNLVIKSAETDSTHGSVSITSSTTEVASASNMPMSESSTGRLPVSTQPLPPMDLAERLDQNWHGR